MVRFTFDFKKADFDALRKALSVTSLDMGFDESNYVDQCWESWRDLFLNAVESFIPKIKLKDANSPRWIYGEIIKLSRKKKQLLKQAKTV